MKNSKFHCCRNLFAFGAVPAGISWGEAISQAELRTHCETSGRRLAADGATCVEKAAATPEVQTEEGLGQQQRLAPVPGGSTGTFCTAAQPPRASGGPGHFLGRSDSKFVRDEGGL